MTREETLASTIRALGLAFGIIIIGAHTDLLFAAPIIGAGFGLGIAALVVAGRYRVVPGTPVEVVRR